MNNKEHGRLTTKKYTWHLPLQRSFKANAKWQDDNDGVRNANNKNGRHNKNDYHDNEECNENDCRHDSKNNTNRHKNQANKLTIITKVDETTTERTKNSISIDWRLLMTIDSYFCQRRPNDDYWHFVLAATPQHMTTGSWPSHHAPTNILRESYVV